MSVIRSFALAPSCRRRTFTLVHSLSRLSSSSSSTLLRTAHPTLAHPQHTRPTTSTTSTTSTTAHADTNDAIYHGPLSQTFRRLKYFSLGSLGLTCTMTPFLFILESALPLSARIFLAATAVLTSGISTALVGWCGAPYVVTLRPLPDHATRRQQTAGKSDVQGLEMTTCTLMLRELTTKVYDADFLVPTHRPFATWALPHAVQLPDATVAPGKAGAPGTEETVAETRDRSGDIVGRWVVTWGERGEGRCRGVGRVVRYFNVHEELL